MKRSRLISVQLAPRRRGLAGGALVVGLTTLLGVAGLVINYAFIAYLHEQLRTGAAAAAGAGAAQLMNDDVLFPARTSDAPALVKARQQARVLRARLAAQHVAELNLADHEPLVLDPNVDNAPKGDLVVGNVANPTQPGSPLQTDIAPINTMRVHAQLSATHSHPMTLWGGNLIGRSTIDVAAIARATVDQRVIGFQPILGATIPLMPIGIRRSGPTSWAAQAFTPAIAGLNDQFTIHPVTGQITSGSDGIPEVLLAIPASDPLQVAVNAAALRLPGTPDNAAALQANLLRQVRQGLAAADLPSGTIQQGHTTATVSLGVPSGTTLLSVAALSRRGEVVAWPLGSYSLDAANRPQFAVEGFAAGTIVDAYLQDATGQTVMLLVQPSLLRTPTALLAEGQPLNPWIGKIVFNQ